MRYFVLVGFALLLSAGQILFKQAALASVGKPPYLMLLNGWMIAALFLYAVATGLWVWILRSTHLSTAYPFVALGFILVPIAAHYMFGEQITIRYASGMALVIVGLVIINR